MSNDFDNLFAARARLDARARSLGLTPASAPLTEAHSGRLKRLAAKSLAEAPLDESEEKVDFNAFVLPPMPPPSPEALEKERRIRVQAARIESRIPDSCFVCPRGCRWSEGEEAKCGHCGARLICVTWKLLQTLVNKEGHRAFVGAILPNESTVMCHGVLADVRNVMRSSSLTILIGDTRAGKSITAAAFLNGEIEAGAAGARWVNESSLHEPGELERALGARLLVLDDVGMGLKGVKSGAYDLPRLAGPFIDFMNAWSRLRGRRLVMTTWLDFDGMADPYGAGIAARATEGAVVIRIVRS